MTLKLYHYFLGYWWSTQNLCAFCAYRPSEATRNTTESKIDHLELNMLVNTLEDTQPLMSFRKYIVHLKLGLTKNFMKGMDYQGSGFQYSKNNFKGILIDKLEPRNFTGSQIHSVIHDTHCFPLI